MNLAKKMILASATAVALSACSSMPWNNTRLAGSLSGGEEVPAVNTAGRGTLEGSYNKDTHKLVYTVTYEGLSGPATAAHFHGPANVGQNAGVVIPFPNAANPIKGEATLTDAQAADLLAGRWYVNVHTRAHPGGEIRAQVGVR
jgi:hypothetical protein